VEKLRDGYIPGVTHQEDYLFVMVVVLGHAFGAVKFQIVVVSKKDAGGTPIHVVEIIEVDYFVLWKPVNLLVEAGYHDPQPGSAAFAYGNKNFVGFS
jgi:hypothetical protein